MKKCIFLWFSGIFDLRFGFLAKNRSDSVLRTSKLTKNPPTQCPTGPSALKPNLQVTLFASFWGSARPPFGLLWGGLRPPGSLPKRFQSLPSHFWHPLGANLVSKSLFGAILGRFWNDFWEPRTLKNLEKPLKKQCFSMFFNVFHMSVKVCTRVNFKPNLARTWPILAPTWPQLRPNFA